MATPFALLAEAPMPPVNRTPAFSYDPQRQVNVIESGRPVVDIDPSHNPSYTQNDKGCKKDDDWTMSAAFGPTMTHNSTGLKKDDD